MQIVRCETHGSICLLKTGVKDGPNKGKSFYVCTTRDATPCNFAQPAEVPPSHCLRHEDALVELQALVHNEAHDCHRLLYRCVVGKKEGQKWCGNIPWSEKNTERSPLADKMNQDFNLPPVRNPFKAPNKVDQSSEWRKLQEGDTERAVVTKSGKSIDGESHKKTKEDQKHNKEAEKELNRKCSSEGAAALDEERASSAQQESWRTKKLPAGMKIKKRASDEERKHSSHGEGTASSVQSSEGSEGYPSSSECEEIKDRQTEKQTKSNTSRARDEGKKQETAATEALQSEASQQNPFQKAGVCSEKTAAHVVKANITSSKPSASSVNSQLQAETKKTHSPQSGKQSNPSSSLQGVSASTKQVTNNSQDTVSGEGQDQIQKSKTTVNTPFGDWSGDDDDDDDDVQLVSVQPAPEQASKAPAAPVQKTLTSFPGFQPASKVKGQDEDPRVLHSQLAAQLKQKKATLSAVNVSALPDKGERLKSQVKELEDALDALSLTSVALTDSQDGDSDTQKKPLPFSHFNPFSRSGGTTYLAEAPTLFQQKSSASSLDLHLSQGYTQMYGVNPQNQAFYGGRMTENRLIAVRNATTEAIDHLHHSLESCPSSDTEAQDPKGIKVQLLPHQRRALAWLLWRETQKPCGGILGNESQSFKSC